MVGVDLRLENEFEIFVTWTANVQPSTVNLRRMKLKNLIPLRYRTKLIQADMGMDMQADALWP